MKKYFLFLSSILGILLFLNSCKKDDPCPIAFRYTIVDSITLEPLVGYHSGARYDPELFEFRMNVNAEKDISYQIGQDSGAVFTIRLSNIEVNNIISNSYVLYDNKILDTLIFFSSNPSSGLESIYSIYLYNKLLGINRIYEKAGVFLNCGYSNKINTIIINI